MLFKRNYFLFLEITSAPPATTAIPARAATPSTPVSGEPLSAPVSTGVVSSAAAVLSSAAASPPPRPVTVNVTLMDS